MYTHSCGSPQTLILAPSLSVLSDDDDFKYLLFTDTLVTTSDTGKELGEFRISVTATKQEGAECFLVHANSHGAIDGVPCGTSITAYVSTKLETFEQQHHEYVKVRIYMSQLIMCWSAVVPLVMWPSPLSTKLQSQKRGGPSTGGGIEWILILIYYTYTCQALKPA